MDLEVSTSVHLPGIARFCSYLSSDNVAFHKLLLNIRKPIVFYFVQALVVPSSYILSAWLGKLLLNIFPLFASDHFEMRKSATNENASKMRCIYQFCQSHSDCNASNNERKVSEETKNGRDVNADYQPLEELTIKIKLEDEMQHF